MTAVYILLGAILLLQIFFLLKPNKKEESNELIKIKNYIP